MQDNSQDFASTAIVALAIKVLSNIDPQLLPPGAATPDYLSKATSNAMVKSEVLEHALNQGGIGPLLLVGQHVSHLAQLPRFEALLRSANSEVLRQKWMRLERYFHYAHRTKITPAGSNQWQCQRYRKQGVPPQPENLLICGIMLGLLQAFGVQLKQCTIGTVTLPLSNGSLDKSKTLTLPAISGLNAEHWTIQWQRIEASNPKFDRETKTESPICQQLAAILKQDIAAQLRVDQAATRLGLSSRSLQRGIKSEGHSFSSIVRGTRIQSACQMLTQSETSIADIGFCCGFADQAHFQRNFKRATNMTPASYRLL